LFISLQAVFENIIRNEGNRFSGLGLPVINGLRLFNTLFLKILPWLVMIATFTFPAAPANVVGKVFTGSAVNVPGENFGFPTTGASVTAARSFVLFQGVSVNHRS
jgi:hypothetical protein